MKHQDLEKIPHRRLNPLTQEWVLVSPQRTDRPWLGKTEGGSVVPRLQYDPACYLCPNNPRVGGVRNPPYQGIFVFDNDFPALLPQTSDMQVNEGGLIVASRERGICKVLCFSPRHDLTISRMSSEEIRAVVDGWVELFVSLSAIPWVRHIQIFENCGAMMGASNPHPHCQIWANATIPNETVKEQASLAAYYNQNNGCLLCNYLRLELQSRERIVCENEAFAVVVPYWAVWPFETLVLSKRHLGAMDELTASERDLLAGILKRITTRYDNLFEVPFPYSMGFHQRPIDGDAHPECHFHAHYYPPLLRSATVQKFMVGYELLASPQRDLTPESAAARLREMSEVHYATRNA
jgi:UDPglucose--hexose-1-phosphate uridylyltransferase